MTNSQAIILGIVQGITEYIPVSSSAHLVIFPNIMGWNIPAKEAFIFDVLVQLGTLFGVVIYFKESIKRIILDTLLGIKNKKPFGNENARIAWLVVLATLPALLFGPLLKGFIASYFASPKATCLFLLVTGILLLLVENFSHQSENNISRKNALGIGFMQAFAMLPGISRSGSTIAAGLALGINRQKAAEFSFFMSIPVMLGASILAFDDLFRDRYLVSQMAIPLVCGFFSAAISGYIVIKWFMGFISSKKLFLFAIYCLVAGSIGAIYFNNF